MIIREINTADVEDFIALARQLGYEASANHVAKRICERKHDETVFVCEVGGRVIAWVDCKISETYLVDKHCEIAGFVVDETYRSRGIGRALMLQVEDWARENGVYRVALRSNVIRERAHKFYLRNGYSVRKQSMVFQKKLSHL